MGLRRKACAASFVTMVHINVSVPQFDSFSGFSDQGSGLYNGVIEALNMYLKAVAQFF